MAQIRTMEDMVKPHSRIGDLVDGMSRGDREAAAEFIDVYGSRILRRVRAGLSARVRRVYDSQEILSTIGRHLDDYVMQGRFSIECTHGVWALIDRMTDNALVDKARKVRSIRESEQRGAEVASTLRLQMQSDAARLGAARDEADFHLEALLDLLETDDDRTHLQMRMRDATSREISRLLMMTPAGVRKRWQRICEILAVRLSHLRSEAA
ncbi:MAG: hypothetical protein ACR2GY_12850 [Phycisphaerales bacterium]